MSIAKCKKCGEFIMTPEHLDKKNCLCVNCIMKYFRRKKEENFIVCLSCGTAILPRLRDANEHHVKCAENTSNTKREVQEEWNIKQYFLLVMD